MAGLAEEHEEETLVEEVEAWVEQTSQTLVFLAGFLIVPRSFFGVSFGYPSRLTGSWGAKVG